jgi:hypothetical protein
MEDAQSHEVPLGRHTRFSMAALGGTRLQCDEIPQTHSNKWMPRLGHERWVSRHD